MKQILVGPAYGRDYKSKAAVLADFEADKDFIILTFGHPYEGRYCNKTDLEADNVKLVSFRYSQNRKVVWHKL